MQTFCIEISIEVLTNTYLSDYNCTYPAWWEIIDLAAQVLSSNQTNEGGDGNEALHLDIPVRGLRVRTKALGVGEAGWIRECS